ncbi:hypothetical protein TNCV_89671 [Trichonephila clavipes]|nr:hypothetical protein TNCV_89671 [Trichonephila clavipes]
MIRKFEAMETLGIQSGRGRKGVTAQMLDDVATQVEEDRSQIIGCTSVQRRWARDMHRYRSMICFIIRAIRYSGSSGKAI